MKTIIITGANRGIGLATTTKFKQEGWRVIATSRKPSQELESLGCDNVQLDLSDEQSIMQAAKQIKKLTSSIDVLVNNAGILLDLEEPKVDMKKLRATFEVNVFGLIDFCEHMVPLVNEGGRIISISSMASSLLDPIDWGWQMPAYKMSKTAVNMYTRTLAQRLEGDDIVVASLDPGWVATDMGGKEAARKPEDAALDIFDLVGQDVPTGKFWLKGKERQW